MEMRKRHKKNTIVVINKINPRFFILPTLFIDNDTVKEIQHLHSIEAEFFLFCQPKGL
jgi:hypothetical protein